MRGRCQDSQRQTNRPINKLYPLELSEEEEPVVPSSLAKESIISFNSTTDNERPATAVERPARRAAAKKADRRIFSIAQLESIDEFEERSLTGVMVNIDMMTTAM